MPSADLCTEEEIIQLMNRCYESIRKDEVLGPIVTPHVKDWNTHLSTMVDLGPSPFRGAPMPKHTALPSRDADKLVGVA